MGVLNFFFYFTPIIIKICEHIICIVHPHLMNGHCFPGHNKYLLSFSVDVRQSAGEYTYQVYHMHVRKRPTRYCRRTFRYRTSYLTYAKLVRTVPLACSLYNLCLFIDRNFVFPRSITVFYIRGGGGWKQISLVYYAVISVVLLFVCSFMLLMVNFTWKTHIFSSTTVSVGLRTVVETSILYLIRAYKSSKTISARLSPLQSSVLIER